MAREAAGLLTFGIEIEVVAPRRKVAELISQILTDSDINEEDEETFDVAGWKVTRDDSLSACEDCQTEIVSPVLHDMSELAVLAEIISAVNELGADVNESCGIHVHVGGLSWRMVMTLVLIMKYIEPRIYETFKPHVSRMKFAAPIEQEFLKKLENARTEEAGQAKELLWEAWYGRQDSDEVDRYDPSRYHGLNINSFFYRGTIEFRYFNSSLDFGTIERYVNTSLAVAQLALTLTPDLPTP
jgi:Putative amidoligase enzyme